jgi:hypothetical protein
MKSLLIFALLFAFAFFAIDTHTQGQISNANSSRAQTTASAATLDTLRSNPPPRGTPVVVTALNGVELSGMFDKVTDDTLDIVDVAGGLYKVIIASTKSLVFADTTRLTTEERKRMASLQPETGKLRELAGKRRIYLWANNDAARQAILDEVIKYGAFEVADSFRQAEFFLYFVGRTERTDPPFSVPQLFGRLYVYTLSDAKRLRVLWEQRQASDYKGVAPVRNAAIASSARTAIDLARAFIHEHKRAFSAKP